MIKVINCRWWANLYIYIYLLSTVVVLSHNPVQSFYLKSKIRMLRVWLVKVYKVFLHPCLAISGNQSSNLLVLGIVSHYKGLMSSCLMSGAKTNLVITDLKYHNLPKTSFWIYLKCNAHFTEWM